MGKVFLIRKIALQSEKNLTSMTTFVCPAVQRDVKFVQLRRKWQNFRNNAVLFRVIPHRKNGAIFAAFGNLNFDPVYLLVTRKTFHLLNNKTRHTLLKSILYTNARFVFVQNTFIISAKVYVYNDCPVRINATSTVACVQTVIMKTVQYSTRLGVVEGA